MAVPGKSSSAETFLLIETAAGYALVHVREWDHISQDIEKVRLALASGVGFSSRIECRGWLPFKDAAEALENVLNIKEGKASECLRAFLVQSLPKKKKKYVLGVCDGDLAKNLSEIVNSVNIAKDLGGLFEVYRYCRVHIGHIVSVLKKFETVHRFQLGLAHSFSRAAIKYDPRRQDKHCQQAVSLLEVVDKTVNKLGMRVKEWYGWHFPELSVVLRNNNLDEHKVYCRCVLEIGIKEKFMEDEERRAAVLAGPLEGRGEVLEQIVAALKNSMGQDIFDLDMSNIEISAQQVLKLSKLRENMAGYLDTKMAVVAPNLKALLGDILGGRLIAQAGSVTQLAKSPASTIQILGAEKALFRALKAKGPTPKYGLLFNSSYVTKASQKNKGRISRYLANKIALASRLDAFSDLSAHAAEAGVNSVYGEQLRLQVEDRLKQLADKKFVPLTNEGVMKRAAEILAEKLRRIRKARKAHDGEKHAKREKHGKHARREKTEKTEKREKIEKRLRPEQPEKHRSVKKDRKAR